MTNHTCPAPNSIELKNTPHTFSFLGFNGQEHKMMEYFLFELKGFIAGGFACHHLAAAKDVKLPYGDIDFYFHTEEDYQKALERVKIETGYSDSELESKPYLGESIRASTFHLNTHVYQLIKATFGTVEEIFDTFDFTNSKVAIRENQSLHLYPHKLELVFDDLLPDLLNKKICKYSRQTHLVFNTDDERKTHAKSNLQRLEKYLQRFPNGLDSQESREQILQQYAWNLKYKPHHSPILLPKLTELLVNATQDELIMFFPLGGEWKKAFETQGKSLVPPQSPIMPWDIVNTGDPWIFNTGK